MEDKKKRGVRVRGLEWLGQYHGLIHWCFVSNSPAFSKNKNDGMDILWETNAGELSIRQVAERRHGVGYPSWKAKIGKLWAEQSSARRFGVVSH